MSCIEASGCQIVALDLEIDMSETPCLEVAEGALQQPPANPAITMPRSNDQILHVATGPALCQTNRRSVSISCDQDQFGIKFCVFHQRPKPIVKASHGPTTICICRQEQAMQRDGTGLPQGALADADWRPRLRPDIGESPAKPVIVGHIIGPPEP